MIYKSCLQVRLRMENKSEVAYNVIVFVLVRSTTYTGRAHKVVKQERREITVGPNSGIITP